MIVERGQLIIEVVNKKIHQGQQQQSVGFCVIPVYANYRKSHPGRCIMNSRRCYLCGESGHIKRKLSKKYPRSRRIKRHLENRLVQRY